jgi:hypothetical protein
MMVSVPTRAGGGVAVLALSATTGTLPLPGLGRSQGPAVQSQYVLASTNPMATIRKRLNNEDRVKMVQSFNLNRKRTLILLSPNFCVKLINLLQVCSKAFCSGIFHQILVLGLVDLGRAPL